MGNIGKEIKITTMKKITGSEPISPIVGNSIETRGLTIRQYYAGLAMQGFIASTNWADFTGTDSQLEALVELSVKSSDKLIEQLNKD